MTISNLIEIVVLMSSILAVARIVKHSNQAVEDLDGIGVVMKKLDEKGIIIAHF
ncbi:MAG: hypothetical protein ACRDBO_16860 [Lachnospiraceae bacterium]